MVCCAVSWTVESLSRNQWGGVGARILAFGEASREGFLHAGNFVEFLLGGAECLFYIISPPQQKLERYPPVTRTKKVLHSGCLVEDLSEKSELTLPTLVQYRYVHGSVLHKGHLRCQHGGLRDSAGGAEP